MVSAFTPFPKIPRLFKPVVISEKIDGTNGAIRIVPKSEGGYLSAGNLAYENDTHFVWAQSRNRDIFPDSDNFGFAKWVWKNADNLTTELGEGVHFGEWWGSGINRGYGFKNGEKKFSLFNRGRWGVFDEYEGKHPTVPGLDVVPAVYEGDFNTVVVEMAMDTLKQIGSYAAPGFMDPEGVVIYHSAAGQLFKVTYDAGPKSQGGGGTKVRVEGPPPTPQPQLVLAA